MQQAHLEMSWCLIQNILLCLCKHSWKHLVIASTKCGCFAPNTAGKYPNVSQKTSGKGPSFSSRILCFAANSPDVSLQISSGLTLPAPPPFCMKVVFWICERDVALIVEMLTWCPHDTKNLNASVVLQKMPTFYSGNDQSPDTVCKKTEPDFNFRNDGVQK